MIVTCPSCRKRYLVDDSAISAGRLVRCFCCSTTWFQEQKDSLFSLRELRRYIFQGLVWSILGIVCGLLISECIVPFFVKRQYLVLDHVNVCNVVPTHDDNEVCCRINMHIRNIKHSTLSQQELLFGIDNIIQKTYMPPSLFWEPNVVRIIHTTEKLNVGQHTLRIGKP